MKTKKLVYCALFSVIIGIMSQISIPVQPVPVNMGIFAVLLAGGILGKKDGTLSVAVYILLGIAGVPVFSGFRGGLIAIAGPTGGYIAGYLIVAFITGVVCDRTEKLKYIILFLGISVVLCYALGTVWYCFVMKSSIVTALTLCVFPFIPGDIVKVVLAGILINKKIRIG